MRGYGLDKYKKFTDIRLGELPDPTPKEDEVIIECYSAGLNLFDILQIEGKYQDRPPFPFVLGYEVAGRISDSSPIPEGSGFKRGDRVTASVQGAFAEKVCAKLDRTVKLPDRMPFDQGAGLHVTFGTVYEALFGSANLKAGEWLLVIAAAGGVGLAAVQLGIAKGANVIAVASSKEKLQIVSKYGGAKHLVNRLEGNWQQKVLEITGGRGVNVVFDPAGIIAACTKCMAWKARALVIGFAAGQIEKLPLNLVLLKNISVIGLYWAPYYEREPERIKLVWRDLIDMFTSGKVIPAIFPTIYQFEDLVIGLKTVNESKTWGRAILRIREEQNAPPAQIAKL